MIGCVVGHRGQQPETQGFHIIECAAGQNDPERCRRGTINRFRCIVKPEFFAGRRSEKPFRTRLGFWQSPVDQMDHNRPVALIVRDSPECIDSPVTAFDLQSGRFFFREPRPDCFEFPVSAPVSCLDKGGEIGNILRVGEVTGLPVRGLVEDIPRQLGKHPACVRGGDDFT